MNGPYLVISALLAYERIRLHYKQLYEAYWLNSKRWDIEDKEVLLMLKKERNRRKAEAIVAHDRVLTERHIK